LKGAVEAANFKKLVKIFLNHAFFAMPKIDMHKRANIDASTLSGIKFCCSISWN